MSASGSNPVIMWTDVNSSHIVRVAYVAETHRLGIEFRSGAFFAYEDVPLDVYYGLIGAQSVGQYFDRVVKKTGLYDYERFLSKEGLENKLLHQRP